MQRYLNMNNSALYYIYTYFQLCIHNKGNPKKAELRDKKCKLIIYANCKANQIPYCLESKRGTLNYVELAG